MIAHLTSKRNTTMKSAMNTTRQNSPLQFASFSSSKKLLSVLTFVMLWGLIFAAPAKADILKNLKKAFMPKINRYDVKDKLLPIKINRRDIISKNTTTFADGRGVAIRAARLVNPTRLNITYAMLVNGKWKEIHSYSWLFSNPLHFEY